MVPILSAYCLANSKTYSFQLIPMYCPDLGHYQPQIFTPSAVWPEAYLMLMPGYFIKWTLHISLPNHLLHCHSQYAVAMLSFTNSSNSFTLYAFLLHLCVRVRFGNRTSFKLLSKLFCELLCWKAIQIFLVIIKVEQLFMETLQANIYTDKNNSQEL